MQTMRLVFAVASLAGATAATAADAAVQRVLAIAREVAQSGRYEHALRIVDQSLAQTPDVPELVELRTQLVEAAARETGNAVTVPATAGRLPAIVNRHAGPGMNFTVESSGIAMIWIAPGSFLMSNPQGSDDDTFVTLSRGYWLGRTEVTQEQVRTVMEHLPPSSFFRGSDRPAERITWLSAMEFGQIVTEHERAAGRLPDGYEYTLPTEAQWEYACRAGTTGPFAGDLMAMAWFEANSDRQTHPVGQKQPNTWGLYDMHGNVTEWCLDGFDGYPGGRVTDLMIGYDGPSAAMARMVRGGSWGSFAGQCRSAYRYQYQVNYATAGLGFRLALAPERKAATSASAAGN